MPRYVTGIRLQTLRATGALLLGLCLLNTALADMLTGNIGVSRQWGSSWMDFGQAASFRSGETLKITLTQDGAKRVVVRLLPVGASPDEPVGIIGSQPIAVQDGGVVIITLDRNYSNIRQLSVHGGAQAWKFALGANNGPAEIISVELTK